MTTERLLTSDEAQGNEGRLGRYRLLAKLGQGGMADVFLAVAQGPAAFNKLVVIKRLRGAIAGDEQHVRMFIDEAKLSARLNHPNVVQIYEVGASRGGYFMVMEYLEGQPLKRIARSVARGEPGALSPPPGAWVRIIADTLNGLHHAHELCGFDGAPLGIVHRDVSPHNIFVTYDGAVKLVDFGVAKASLNTTQTESGVLKGKISYMAPEQLTARRSVDRRADIFATGVVLWELLAGRRLFEGDHVAVMQRLLVAPIPRLSTVVPGVPRALDEIVAKALERAPERRFAGAHEMSEALEEHLNKSGEHVRAEHLGAWMLGMFAGSRARTREQVKEQLEQPSFQQGASVEGQERSSTLTGSGSMSFPSAAVAGLPMLGEQSHSGVLGRPQAGSDSATLRGAEVPASPLSGRGVLFGALGLSVLIASGVAAVAFSARQQVEPASSDGAVASEGGAPKVDVLITSDPPGAMVKWKGEQLGTTPLRTRLPAGTQVVVLSRAEHWDETVMLALSPSEALQRSVALRRKDPMSPVRETGE